MPTYKITDPQSGKTIRITGDSPPSEKELIDIFAKVGGSAPAKAPAPTAAPSNVPQWGRDNPRLYGLAGAATETLSPVLQALGLAGGGILGAPAGPAGVVGGAAGGYAAAKGIEGMARQALGVEKPPQSFTEAFGRTGENLKSGAEMEVGGQVAGKALSTIAGKVPDAMTLLRQQLMGRTGVPMSVGMQTLNKPTALVEKGLSYLPTSSGVMKRQYDETVGGINKYMEGIVQPQGGNLAYEGGQAAQASAAQRGGAAKRLASKAYDAVFNDMPEGTPIPTPNRTKVANEMADELSQSKLAKGDLYSTAQKLTEDSGVFDRGGQTLQNTTQGPYGDIKLYGERDSEWRPFQDQTLTGIKMDREWLTSRITEAQKAGASDKVRRYTMLKKATDADLDAFAESQGSDFYEKYKLANKIYAEGQKTLPGANIFKDKDVKRIIDAEPAKIIDLVFKPKNTEIAGKLKQAVGPKTWNKMQDGWLEKSFMNDKGDFSAVKFHTEWSKFDEPTRDILTSGRPGLKSKLNDLGELGETLEKYEQMAGNPSKTAMGFGSVVQMADVARNIFTMHPAVAAAEVLLPYGAAKFMTSQPGMRLLINGIKAPANSPQALNSAVKAIAIYTGIPDEQATGLIQKKMDEMNQQQQAIQSNPIDSYLDERVK